MISVYYRNSRDPFNNPSEVFKRIVGTFSNKWEKPDMSIELYDHVHPNLAVSKYLLIVII